VAFRRVGNLYRVLCISQPDKPQFPGIPEQPFLYLVPDIPKAACNLSKLRFAGIRIAVVTPEPSVLRQELFVKQKPEGRKMRYGIAWLLGVPVSVLVLWYLVTHLL
jgi:hypothetical protein